MNNEKETITLTLPKRLVDKLREIDRLVCNADLGQTLAESCGWRLENLTDSKSDEIHDFLEDDNALGLQNSVREGCGSYCREVCGVQR